MFKEASDGHQLPKGFCRSKDCLAEQKGRVECSVFMAEPKNTHMLQLFCGPKDVFQKYWIFVFKHMDRTYILNKNNGSYRSCICANIDKKQSKFPQTNQIACF